MIFNQLLFQVSTTWVYGQCRDFKNEESMAAKLRQKTDRFCRTETETTAARVSNISWTISAVLSRSVCPALCDPMD